MKEKIKKVVKSRYFKISLFIISFLVFIVTIYYYIETKQYKIPIGVLPIEERNSISNSLEELRK